MSVVEGKQRGIYPGWFTVLATGVVSAWAWASWGYGFGTYFDPLQREFGWTRAQISAGYSLRRLEGGVEGPFGGMLTDRYGPRIVSFVGVAIAGLGLVIMYFMTEYWQFLLLWGLVVSLGFNLGTLDPLEKALSDWFVRKRGLAVGIARVGLSLGGTFGPAFMTTLLIRYGWRIAFLIAGLITWIVCLPMTWFLVKPHRPEFYGLMPDGATVEEEAASSKVDVGQDYAAEVGEVEFTVRQAVRTLAFWVMAVESLLISFVSPCISVHMIPYLIDMGVDPMGAAVAMGFTLLMSAPARFFIGPVCDRCSIHRFKYVRMAAQGLRILGLFIFMNSRTLTMVYVSAAVYGLGQGMSAGSRTPMRGRFFGRKAFSTIHGTAMLVSMPMSILAPIYIGWVFDVTNSYRSAFFNACILGVFALVAIYFLNPPKARPEVKSDIESFL